MPLSLVSGRPTVKMSDIDTLFPAEQVKSVSMKEIDEMFRVQSVEPRRGFGEIAVMPETTITAEAPTEPVIKQKPLTGQERDQYARTFARLQPPAGGTQGPPEVTYEQPPAIPGAQIGAPRPLELGPEASHAAAREMERETETVPILGGAARGFRRIREAKLGTPQGWVQAVSGGVEVAMAPVMLAAMTTPLGLALISGTEVLSRIPTTARTTETALAPLQTWLGLAKNPAPETTRDLAQLGDTVYQLLLFHGMGEIGRRVAGKIRVGQPPTPEEAKVIQEVLPKRGYEQPPAMIGGDGRAATQQIIRPGEVAPTGPIVGAAGEPIELTHRLAVSGIRESDAKALGLVPAEYDWRQVETLRTGGAERTVAPPTKPAEVRQPVTETAPAEPPPVIPEFKSTEEAEAFGRQADESTLNELARRRRETLGEFERLRARGKATGPRAQQLGLKGQFYREAIEAKGQAEIEPTGAEVTPRLSSLPESEYWILPRLANGEIQPGWVIDRATGKVKMRTEYAALLDAGLPKSRMNMQKPTVEELETKGGASEGNLDDLATEYWAEDSEKFRADLIRELERWKAGPVQEPMGQPGTAPPEAMTRVQARERIQELDKAIAEGEVRLRSKVGALGERLSQGILEATQRAVEEAKAERETLAGKYGKLAGEPTKFKETAAGPQGEMFNVQAQYPRPEEGISSAVRPEEQVRGTMFEQRPAEEPALFGAPVEKQPWEMTKEEWSKSSARQNLLGEIGDKVRASDVSADRYHRNTVYMALDEGKAVPPEVLKDYPDLAQAEPTTFGAGLGQLFAGRGGKPQWPSQEQTPLRSLADVVSKAAPDSPIGERMSIAEAIGDRVTRGAGTAVRDLARLRSGALGMVSTYAAPPKWTSLDDAIGKCGYAVERSEMEARAFARDIMRSAPNRLRQEAISRYIQADGDEALLGQQADQSKPRFKRIYEAATQLTPEEKAVANQVNAYHDAMLQEAINAGFLEHGVQNYMMGVWERENPVTRRIMAEVQLGKFQPNPSFIRQKVFQDYFEGEQLGYTPADSRFGYLVAARDIAFKRALAARVMLKAMHEGKASDGRPLVEVSGGGKTIPGSEAPEAYLIYPKLKPENTEGYRPFDHPALRGWKWATKDEYSEAPVFVQGELLLHPEAFQRIKNMLSSSAFRADTLPGAIGRLGLRVSSTLKQTLLSFSGFHQVQEGLHSMFHGVNPFNPKAINLDDPVTRKLVEHGMVVSPEFGALENFSEGVQAAGIAGKIPGVGPFLQQYTEYLFQDYIPRLKVAMGKEAFRRNTKRYGDKLSEDEIYGLTARQADAAFGMLNRNFLDKHIIKGHLLGRNPTLQSFFRLMALAPDFLEARTRFVGQALLPYGREQLVAVAVRGALGLYATSRILNYLLDDNPHWDRPFEVVASGRIYRLRSVPGDIEHLIEDPRSFVYYRLNPFYTRTALEALTGRDQFGRKRSVADQLTDVLKNAVPIPLQSLTDQRDRELWESLVQSFGLSETQYRSSAAQEALDKTRDMMPLGAGTEERRESNRVARRLEDQLRNKKATMKEVREAVRSGQITPQEARRVRQQARDPELVVNFRRLPLADALDVWDKADSDERRLLAPILRRKQGLLRNVLPAQRKKLGLRFREALMKFYERPPATRQALEMP
jgi:hypothetical protein